MNYPQQHAAVWAAIERIAADRRLTPSGLAKLAGFDATAFNKSKRIKRNGWRWPSTETIAGILAATGTTWAEFGRIVDNERLSGQTVFRSGSGDGDHLVRRVGKDGSK